MKYAERFTGKGIGFRLPDIINLSRAHLVKFALSNANLPGEKHTDSSLWLLEALDDLPTILQARGVEAMCD
jgi:hypothetical protein